MATALWNLGLWNFAPWNGATIAAGATQPCTVEPFPQRLAEFAQAVLLRARDLNAGLMPETVVIKRGSLSNDGYGQASRGYATPATTKARVRAYNERLDAPLGGGVEAASVWVFTMPFGVDVADADHIERDGVIYEVVGLQQRASYSSSVTVYAREI